MKKVLFSLLLVVFLLPQSVFALNEVNIYFFHSDTCNICEQEKIYLKALKQDRYPNMRIHYYEISNQDNFKLMQHAKEMFGESRSGVPFTIIADKPFYGFTQGLKGSFQKTVYEASINKYEDKLGKELGIIYDPYLDGEVKEYKENSNYTIEETSGKEHVVVDEKKEIKKKIDWKKYRASMILVGIGIVLAIIFAVLKVLESRGRF